LQIPHIFHIKNKIYEGFTMGFAKKAHALAAEMEERFEAGKSLYKEKHKEGRRGMVSLSLSFHESVESAFVLLKKHGYSQYISDKGPEGDKRNGFKAIIRYCETNPQEAPHAFGHMDVLSLGQFVYMVNNNAMADRRNLIPVLKGRCLEAILQRAAELGSLKP